MMDKEYHVAFLNSFPLDLHFFKKKLTVTGTNGNTQGVNTAKSPVIRQSQKVDQREPSSPFIAADGEATALTLTEKVSSPEGNSSFRLASHVIVPLILALSFAAIFNNCFHTTLSLKNLISDPPVAESIVVLRLPLSCRLSLRYCFEVLSKSTEVTNASSGDFFFAENTLTPS